MCKKHKNMQGVSSVYPSDTPPLPQCKQSVKQNINEIKEGKREDRRIGRKWREKKTMLEGKKQAKDEINVSYLFHFLFWFLIFMGNRTWCYPFS